MSDFPLFDAAGWREGRQVDIAGDLAALRGDGYAVWPRLEALLHEFSGLDVTKGRAVVEVGATEAIACTERDDSLAFEEYAGQRLAPVAYNSALTVFLAEDGLLYGGYAELFGPLGSELKSVVSALLVGPPAPALQPVPGMLV